MTQPGVKFDQQKIKWQLLPWAEVEEVAQVMDDGARKYSPDNWKHVPDSLNRYFNAAVRHLVAWQKGEKQDPESGRAHLAHCICCLLFMMWWDKQGEKHEKV